MSFEFFPRTRCSCAGVGGNSEFRNRASATCRCSGRAESAWQGASSFEHCGVDGIGRFSLRQPTEPGRIADDPGETRQPTQVKGIVPQCEEEENIRLPHVR